MKIISSKLRYRIASFCIALALILICVFPSQATDIDDLEDTTSNLEDELSNLNNDLESLSAQLDAITALIQDTAAELTVTREELAIAKGEEQVQSEAMALRIKYMYENGNSSFLEILLSSRSMAEFVSRAEYIAAITEYDRDMLDELTSISEEIAEKEKELEEKQASLNTLQAELDAKEQEINAKISETSSDLSAYTAKLEAAREEARKAEEALKEEIVPVIPEEPSDDSEEDLSDDSSQDIYEDSSSENSSEDASDIPSEDTSEIIETTASDLELLAALIECEAGTSDYEGMLAVGSVVVNRMKSRYYPDTLRGVIYQSGQFTPALNGKVDAVLERGVNANCVAAAQDALNGKNNVGDCLQFRSASSGHVGTIIGDNVFF